MMICGRMSCCHNVDDKLSMEEMQQPCKDVDNAYEERVHGCSSSVMSS